MVDVVVAVLHPLVDQRMEALSARMISGAAAVVRAGIRVADRQPGLVVVVVVEFGLRLDGR
jgi:hypothetical protein